MKIALAQLDFLVGDIHGNAQRIIDETKKTSADLIVFPELALCGYPPEDLLFRPAFYAQCEAALKKIIDNTQHKTIIVGYPEKQGTTYYNKACVIQDGSMIADYAKQVLPNDTVFDEKRYFTAGEKPCVFTLQGIKIGLVICEDVWHANPIAMAKNAGAECIVAINASPFNLDQASRRDIILKQRVSENQLPILYVNTIGGQDELVFDGGSLVINARGEKIQQAPYFEENIMIAAVEKNNADIAILSQSMPDPIATEKNIYDVLTLGTRDYILKNHFKGALIGLSGGIDSALTLAIAVDAIGADKITALIMPSEYTAKMSIEDAITEATTLGVDYHVIEIDALKNKYLDILDPFFKNAAIDATEENLQARIRGMLLMAFSNKFGKIVLTTGNKSEMAVGYTTLYGDMAGGFSVLKDIYKMQVYQLAHYRNSISQVIPERVIKRAPTAELKANQTDQDKLPAYEILDAILKRYIEKDQDAAEIISVGFEKEMVNSIVRMIKRNEYKRRQAPIGIRITQRAFGKDRRYPITSGYK
ncbi:MAG: NAD+ synthase [Gammaproteobacteria bacterium CG_4_10_14_0_8_um_filter_38_16]|nr:MAG: NAD+ synthase [Gammaproteobacteria bacterium CG_4_10_14_0_8_um_filter_38_16]PJA04033.1 MAG: NAD+ synthase [Gammaproteobacteria bacterium CG_4_10_14_0_2_um_filter_38_22]PJB10492.1 MAG: NAD+ synthase [Gammaproteobacteria bacterium CG_4_9_14_3_um_filter_38_9]